MESKKYLTLSLAVLLLAVAVSLFNTVAIQAARPAPSTAPARGYYLTSGLVYTGSQALFACAPGYHMASRFEILDPSNLRYETALGLTTDDSGLGPPWGLAGYIRSGFNSNDVNGSNFNANCNVWTTDSNASYGTLGGLVVGFNSAVWEFHNQPCNLVQRVWCVQD